MPTTVINRRLLEQDPVEFSRLLDIAFPQVDSLSVFYPEFAQWYKSKVLLGLATGERTILMSETGNLLSGIAILKHSETEKKLCCLRVLKPFEGSGVGLRLFDEAFDVLGTTKPLLSISEEQRPKFSRVLNHFGFECAQEYDGLYREKKIEYSFNGLLLVPNEDKN